jgi:cytochrome c oxidase cbb3-type subunit 3
MSNALSWYIIVLTLANILGCFWLIRWASRRRPDEAKEGAVTGHRWDGDLEEYNNPLPRWWLWLFYITIAFGLGYLVLFPGLGKITGALGWTERSQYEQEMERANAKYAPLYANFARKDVAALAADPDAQRVGRRLFLNYCASCHGTDAAGAPGFPNLTDNDWLWGGDPETIKTTIAGGRNGVMPAWGGILGAQGVDEVAAYVSSLSGREADPALVAAGKERFAATCVACHGPEGKGNVAMGAPNLTDNVWLYGGSLQAIKQSIAGGRNGVMPAHGDFLGADKVHVLAAYVYGLSSATRSTAQQTP